MELSKCVYLCAKKLIKRPGKNKLQELINVPRMTIKITCIIVFNLSELPNLTCFTI